MLRGRGALREGGTLREERAPTEEPTSPKNGGIRRKRDTDY